jgi:hypothetical protein
METSRLVDHFCHLNAAISDEPQAHRDPTSSADVRCRLPMFVRQCDSIPKDISFAYRCFPRGNLAVQGEEEAWPSLERLIISSLLHVSSLRGRRPPVANQSKVAVLNEGTERINLLVFRAGTQERKSPGLTRRTR